jgi:hypothetical protein
VACVCCAGPRDAAKSVDPSGSAGRPLTQANPGTGRVRADVLSCDSAEPVGVQETLPDGQLLDSAEGGSAARLRLQVRLQNLAGEDLAVAMCDGGLVVLPPDAVKPYCGPLQDSAWTTFPAGASMLVYPTMAQPDSGGIVTLDLGPRQYVYDRRYVPEPVSFRLTGAQCFPLSAEEAVELRHKWQPEYRD